MDDDLNAFALPGGRVFVKKKQHEKKHRHQSNDEF